MMNSRSSAAPGARRVHGRHGVHGRRMWRRLERESGGSASSGGSKVTELSVQAFPDDDGNDSAEGRRGPGHLQEERLDVSVSDGAAGPAMVAALAAGKVDAIGVPMFVGMQSVMAGAKIKALIGLVGGGGSVVMVSNRVPKADATYPESAQVLDGRTAAISAPGGFWTGMFRKYVDGAGATLKYQTLPGVAPEVAAMKAGKVDAVNFDLASSYPFVKSGVGHILWDFQNTGPTELQGASTSEAWVSDKFAKENPDGRRGIHTVDRPGGRLDQGSRQSGGGQEVLLRPSQAPRSPTRTSTR